MQLTRRGGAGRTAVLVAWGSRGRGLLRCVGRSRAKGRRRLARSPSLAQCVANDCRDLRWKNGDRRAAGPVARVVLGHANEQYAALAVGLLNGESEWSLTERLGIGWSSAHSPPVDDAVDRDEPRAFLGQRHVDPLAIGCRCRPLTTPCRRAGHRGDKTPSNVLKRPPTMAAGDVGGLARTDQGVIMDVLDGDDAATMARCALQARGSDGHDGRCHRLAPGALSQSERRAGQSSFSKSAPTKRSRQSSLARLEASSSLSSRP